jgi:hypothetical protein
MTGRILQFKPKPNDGEIAVRIFEFLVSGRRCEPLEVVKAWHKENPDLSLADLHRAFAAAKQILSNLQFLLTALNGDEPEDTA